MENKNSKMPNVAVYEESGLVFSLWTGRLGMASEILEECLGPSVFCTLNIFCADLMNIGTVAILLLELRNRILMGYDLSLVSVMIARNCLTVASLLRRPRVVRCHLCLRYLAYGCLVEVSAASTGLSHFMFLAVAAPEAWR